MHLSRRASAALAIGIGCVMLYVAASLTWHRMKNRFYFEPDFPKYSAAGDAVFLDFEGWVSPYKPYDVQNKLYFPAELGHSEWEGAYFRRMDERSLSIRESAYYRILILRFGHEPMCFRITIAKEGTAKFRTLVLSGRSGYRPGYPKVARERELTPEETASVIAVLSMNGSWKESRRLAPVDPFASPENETNWVFEESSPEGYQFDFAPPEDQNRVRELLLQLSGLPEEQWPPTAAPSARTTSP